MLLPPPLSPLFPYTTLFRSAQLLRLGSGCLGLCLEGLTPGITVHLNAPEDRKSTRLNSSHVAISYAVFCLKKKSLHALVTPRRTAAGLDPPHPHTRTHATHI